MIKKYRFGKPINTEATVMELPDNIHDFPDNINLSQDKTQLSFTLKADDVVYGLGENMGGINKRGRKYISNCTDDPNQTESRHSLYAAHNFILVDGTTRFGLFVDYPSIVTFDIGFTDKDELTITIDDANYDLYIVEGNDDLSIIKEFRALIGESYIPPKWAFGYGQSRWGYASEDDIRDVVDNYRKNHLPIDSVYMDIDYMERYKDFTLNASTFPDFSDFVYEMKSQNIHLVPIIDAGVKIESGYDVYEEGVKNNFFCKDENGEDFTVAVWPGRCHMPDFLNPEARNWFGSKYERLINCGIDGFWNDMNEPALFYSEKNLKKTFAKIAEYADKDLTLSELWEMQGTVNSLANNEEDYKSFYHNVNGEKIRHDKVHNLYGYNMTRAASDAFKEICPDKKILMFSRSSYIGMHRYAGIWTGDNASWWSHVELLMHQLPGLNMCGFMYCGADTGGFGYDTNEELLMRFLELSIFTPLLRNHAALGTRDQEIYRFKDIDGFRNILQLRYGLIPYLYDEYEKAVNNNTLLFTPLGIAFPDNKIARHVEDQLMVGESIMIAPVYKPNQTGRYVYLPEDMTLVRFRSLSDYDVVAYKEGHHYVDAAVDEVLIFIRKDHQLYVGKAAENITEVSTSDFTIFKSLIL